MKKLTLISFLLIASMSFAQSWTMSDLPATLVPGATVTVTITYDADAANVIGTGAPEFSWFNLREVTSTGDFIGELGSGTFRNTDLSYLPDNGSGAVAQSGTYTETYTIPDPLPPLTDNNNSYGLGGYITANDGASFVLTSNVAIPPASLSIGDFNEKSNITLFPNPVGNTLYSNSDVVFTEYRIFGITGKIVKDVKNNTVNALDVTNLVSGIYFLETANGIGKFLKK